MRSQSFQSYHADFSSNTRISKTDSILMVLIYSLLCFQLFYADVLCLLLFLAFLVGWGAVAYIGLRSQKTRIINNPLFLQQGT